MAGKLIIDWSKAPQWATMVGVLGAGKHKVWANDEQYAYRDGEFSTGIFSFGSTGYPLKAFKCTGRRTASASSTVSFTEHRMCCGTTCDRTAVARYIERLETVADAAHHLQQSGVLADTPRMQNLKTALEELNRE